MVFSTLGAFAMASAAAARYAALSSSAPSKLNDLLSSVGRQAEERVDFSVGAALEVRGAQERIAAKKEELRRRKEEGKGE